MRICTVGGGSGMPITNRALLRAGFRDIVSVVTTFDSGGDTGRMRTDERGQLLAFSDYWRALISLWRDGKRKKLWQEMLRYRDGRGRNFGNNFFRFLVEKLGDINQADEFFQELMGVKLAGRVVPVATEPADLAFQTLSGQEYRGEHYLDLQRMSTDRVKKIWLEPRVRASPEAIQAIKESQVIIIGPGSLYGSLLANFLPRGMAAAYRQSRARRILIANLMSVANENQYYSQRDYIDIFRRYLKMSRPFDDIIMADFPRQPRKIWEKAMKLYSYEHSRPIRADESLEPQPILADIAIIEKKNTRLRHSAKKLAGVLRKVIG